MAQLKATKIPTKTQVSTLGEIDGMGISTQLFEIAGEIRWKANLKVMLEGLFFQMGVYLVLKFSFLTICCGLYSERKISGCAYIHLRCQIVRQHWH